MRPAMRRLWSWRGEIECRESIGSCELDHSISPETVCDNRWPWGDRISVLPGYQRCAGCDCRDSALYGSGRSSLSLYRLDPCPGVDSESGRSHGPARAFYPQFRLPSFVHGRRVLEGELLDVGPVAYASTTGKGDPPRSLPRVLRGCRGGLELLASPQKQGDCRIGLLCIRILLGLPRPHLARTARTCALPCSGTGWAHGICCGVSRTAPRLGGTSLSAVIVGRNRIRRRHKPSVPRQHDP